MRGTVQVSPWPEVSTLRDYTTLSEAQQARWWVIGEGNLRPAYQVAFTHFGSRRRHGVTALRLAANLPMALTGRRFQPGSKRTYLRELKLGLADKICLPLLAVSLSVFLIVRIRHSVGIHPW